MNEPISLTYDQAQAVAEVSAKVRDLARRHKGYGYTERTRVFVEIGNPYYTERNPSLHGIYLRVEGGGAPVPLFAKDLGQPRTFDAARLPARDEDGHVQHPDMDGIGWDEFNMGPQLRALGWHSTTVSFESDASNEAQERYSESNSPDCSYWTPSRPAGDGWLLAAIYDTEDGPVALYVRSADGVPASAVDLRRPARAPRYAGQFHLNPCPTCTRVREGAICTGGCDPERRGGVAAAAGVDLPDGSTTMNTPLSTLPGFVKPDNTDQVFFYEQDFYVLSNFSAFNLSWKGLVFPTSEHAYHWEKFADETVRESIRLAPSAHEAFKIAERNKALRFHRWDQVKVDIMRRILRAKANQHEYVRRKLLATGDRELIEDSWRDDFWGWGPNREGRNMLGKLWMEIRAELRAKEPKADRPWPLTGCSGGLAITQEDEEDSHG